MYFQSKEDTVENENIINFTSRLASSIFLFFNNVVRLITFRKTSIRFDTPKNSTKIPYMKHYSNILLIKEQCQINTYN